MAQYLVKVRYANSETSWLTKTKTVAKFHSKLHAFEHVLTMYQNGQVYQSKEGAVLDPYVYYRGKPVEMPYEIRNRLLKEGL